MYIYSIISFLGFFGKKRYCVNIFDFDIRKKKKKEKTVFVIKKPVATWRLTQNKESNLTPSIHQMSAPAIESAATKVDMQPVQKNGVNLYSVAFEV